MKWIIATLILLICAAVYPCVYVFGFVMAILTDMQPHSTAIKCIDNLNRVFE